MTMTKKVPLLTLMVFAALLTAHTVSQAQDNTPPATYTGSGLRYGGEVFWPFTEGNLWDPNMWEEDLLPLFQEQHLSFGPWGGMDWCAIQSEGDLTDPDTWDWDLVDSVVRVFAGSGIEPIFPHVGTGDCELTAESEIEDSGLYPPLEDRWDDWYRFVVTTYPVSNGSASILLGADPVLVEGTEAQRVYLPLILEAALHEEAEEIILFDDISSIHLATDSATINEVSIDGDQLHLEVTYSGGCATHEFELYGSRVLLESYPVQAEILLSHDANDDPCDAITTEELVFDLLPLKQAYLQAYVDEGPILLRIHEPGATEPIQPLARYDFCPKGFEL